jgi:hypothetical protein
MAMTAPIQVEPDRVETVPGQVPLPGMPEEGVLFHIDAPEKPAPEPRLSADRRRTLRQREQIDRGHHPLTGTRTRPDLGNCGTCSHRFLQEHHGKSYAKCDAGPRSSGAATDIRRWWPACSRYERSVA